MAKAKWAIHNSVILSFYRLEAENWVKYFFLISIVFCSWQNGECNTDIPLYTAVATFTNSKYGYPDKAYGHAAVFVKCKDNNAIVSVTKDLLFFVCLGI